MSNYSNLLINEIDDIIKENLFCNKNELSVFLNNVYKLGKKDNYEKLIFWKDTDRFSMLSLHSIYTLYTLMYNSKISFNDFDLIQALKDIYKDMVKDEDLIILKDIKENYIMQIINEIQSKNKKKENIKTYLKKNLKEVEFLPDSHFRGFLDKSLRGGKLELYNVPLYFAMYCISQKEHEIDRDTSKDISVGLDIVEKVLDKYKDDYVLYGESIVNKLVDCFSYIFKDIARLVDEGAIFNVENISDNPELYSILHTQGEHSNKLNQVLKYNKDLVLQNGAYGQKGTMGIAVKIKELMNILKFKQESKKEKAINLKTYLQKKLTINCKEAELIESVVKNYVSKKSSSKIKEGFDDVYRAISQFLDEESTYNVHIRGDMYASYLITLNNMYVYDYFGSVFNIGLKSNTDSKTTLNISLQEENAIKSAIQKVDELILTTGKGSIITIKRISNGKDIEGDFRVDSPRKQIQ